MKKIFIVILIFSSLKNYGQAPPISWQMSYGGSVTDIAQSIVKTNDGGSILIGRTSSNDGDVSGNHGLIDCWLVKLDAIGGVQWQHAYGGTGNDIGCSIQQTADSGYVICGSSDSNDGDISGNHAGSTDILVLKIDNAGVIQWQKSIGGTGNETGFSIKQNINGTYILAGYTISNDGDVSGNHGFNDGCLIKLNSLGSIQWQRCFGGSSSDDLYSVQVCNDFGYVLTGYAASSDGDITSTHGGNDCWIIKTDSLGIIEWQKCYGGLANDCGIEIKQTADFGFVVSGFSNSTDGDVTGNHAGSDDIWILKTNSMGVLTWQKSIGGTSTEQGVAIAETNSGDFVVAGIAQSNDGDISGAEGGYDYLLCSLNAFGSIQWLTSFGGTNSDFAHSFFYDSSNESFTVAGNSYSMDGDVSGNHGGSSDFWVVHFDTAIGINETSNDNSITISPNPSNGKFIFSATDEINKIEIYNLLGQHVFQISTNDNRVSIDIHEKEKGIYIYKITSNQNKIRKGKLIIN